MQGTAVASGGTRQLYVHDIIMWRIVLNAAVTVTTRLYSLSWQVIVYLLIVLAGMWHGLIII